MRAADRRVAGPPAKAPAWLGPARSAAKIVFPVLICVIALVVLHRLASQVTLADLADDLAALPNTSIALALLTTAISFCALGSYDVLAVRSAVGTRVPARICAWAGASGYAVSNLLGMAWLTGSTVRYRIYLAMGLDGTIVARVFAYAAVAFWLGLIVTVGLVFVLQPAGLAELVPLSGGAQRAAGLACLALVAAVFAFLARGPRRLRLRRIELALPPPRFALGMMIAAVVDLCAAAMTMWILLPADAAIAFPAFFIVYVTALGLGILSHAPGGLGVFEATVMAGLGATGRSDVLASLVIYRLIFTLLPFVVAAASLAAAFALSRRRPRPQARGEVASATLGSLAPVMAAGVTMVAGAVLLISGNLPVDPADIATLRRLVPLPVAEAAHLTGSIAGALMLVVVRGLLLRLASAWRAAMVLCCVGIVASLVKGIDWEEATVLLVAIGGLLAFRRAFDTPGTDSPFRIDAPWAVTLTGLMIAVVWIGVLAYSSVDFRVSSWWTFAWSGDATRFLRAAVLSAVALLVMTVHSLVYHRNRGGPVV